MMMPSHRVRILVATQPVDFRKGHDGLAALVQSALKEDPFTGPVFVFRDQPLMGSTGSRPTSAAVPPGPGNGSRPDKRERHPLNAASGEWLQTQRLRVSAKSWIEEKLAYIHRHWDGVQTFLHDGRVEIDSNSV